MTDGVQEKAKDIGRDLCGPLWAWLKENVCVKGQGQRMIVHTFPERSEKCK